MPVSHIGLTVSHLPSAVTFYLAALRPLGYRVVRQEAFQVALGTGDEGELFICQDPLGGRPTGTHLAFAASSPSQVDSFFNAALKASARSHTIPNYRGQGLDEYTATVIDMDNNAVEVSYCDPIAANSTRQPPGGAPQMTLPKPPIGNIDAVDPLEIPSIRDLEPTKSQNRPSSAIVGTLFGAAAGAALAYALVKTGPGSSKNGHEREPVEAEKGRSNHHRTDYNFKPTTVEQGRSNHHKTDYTSKPTVVEETTVLSIRRRAGRHSPQASEAEHTGPLPAREGHDPSINGGPTPSSRHNPSDQDGAAYESTRHHHTPKAIESLPARASTFPLSRALPAWSAHSASTKSRHSTIHATSVQEPDSASPSTHPENNAGEKPFWRRTRRTSKVIVRRPYTDNESSSSSEHEQRTHRRTRRHSHSHSHGSHPSDASNSARPWEVALPASLTRSGYTERKAPAERGSEHRSTQQERESERRTAHKERDAAPQDFDRDSHKPSQPESQSQSPRSNNEESKPLQAPQRRFHHRRRSSSHEPHRHRSSRSSRHSGSASSVRSFGSGSTTPKATLRTFFEGWQLNPSRKERHDERERHEGKQPHHMKEPHEISLPPSAQTSFVSRPHSPPRSFVTADTSTPLTRGNLEGAAKAATDNGLDDLATVGPEDSVSQIGEDEPRTRRNYARPERRRDWDGSARFTAVRVGG